MTMPKSVTPERRRYINAYKSRVGWWKTEKGKESNRKTKLKGRFGLTPEQYDQMFKEQGGRCAICDTNTCESGHRLSVDHDHTSGEVRGLLCKACNLVLGNAQDNIETLKRAIEYLGG